MNYREVEIRLLAQHDPIVQAHVTHYDHTASCSWEEAMTLAAIALAGEAKHLRKLAEKMALAEALAPKTFIFRQQSQPRHNRQPAPVEIVEVERLPTEFGKRHYEPDGYYEGYPCTCTEACDHPCKGGCGCDACSMAYGDFLSCE